VERLPDDPFLAEVIREYLALQNNIPVSLEHRSFKFVKALKQVSMIAEEEKQRKAKRESQRMR